MLFLTPKTMTIAAIASLATLAQVVTVSSRAVAQVPPQLSSAQANSLAHDLVSPTAAQRFFQEGNDRLEREIYQLQQQPIQPAEPLLKVSERPVAPPQGQVLIEDETPQQVMPQQP